MGVRAEAVAGAHLSPGGAACAAPRRPMAVSMRTLGVIGEELALALQIRLVGPLQQLVQVVP